MVFFLNFYKDVEAMSQLPGQCQIDRNELKKMLQKYSLANIDLDIDFI